MIPRIMTDPTRQQREAWHDGTDTVEHLSLASDVMDRLARDPPRAEPGAAISVDSGGQDRDVQRARSGDDDEKPWSASRHDGDRSRSKDTQRTTTARRASRSPRQKERTRKHERERSPSGRCERSPSSKRGRSPRGRRERSPSGRRERSPSSKRGRNPRGRRERSPSGRRERSPSGRRERSPRV
jgi:hypothetical protein